MRKLIYHVAASLDGKICRADGSFDCFPMEGDHIGEYIQTLHTYGAVIMGKRTYEVGLRSQVTDPYPWLETYVFSSTLGPSPNPKITVVGEDAVGFTRQLKQREGKPIYLCGGGELATSLLKAGLIDELAVKLNPLLIGEGVEMFQGWREPLPVRLESTKAYGSGVVLLRYEVTPM